MKDQGRNKQQLIEELAVLRKRVEQLQSNGQRHDVESRGSEERFRHIVENINDVIFSLDTEGAFTYVSPVIERLCGFSPEEVIGKNFTEFIHPEDVSGVMKSFSRTLTGQLEPYQFRIFAKDRQIIHVRTSSRILVEKGKVIELSGVMTDISRQIIVEEHLIEALETQSRILEETVHSLISATEQRDPYTAGHQQRVSQVVWAIAKKMSLERDEIKGIRIGALLHDIGKIYVPSEFLSKPGRLNDQEFNVIKLHPEVGLKILQNIHFPWPIGSMVFQHHERLDGSGYPKGIGGDEMIIEARIVAVVDVVEAMCSHRPYRPAPGLDKAFAIIREGRKTKFDPEVVDACIAVFDEGFQFTTNPNNHFLQ
jgi:PAS domain S-box-containing protein/putative nucleotidyltransferase with HDIG domain